MADLKTLDFAYLGQPMVDGKNNPAIDLSTLDYAYLAQPFCGALEIGGTIEPPVGGVEEFVPWICVF